MGRIIVTVVLVVVLAVLVSMNLGYTTSVNLFGFRFDNVSVVAVAALSFAIGVVYSLLIYIGRFLHRRARRGLANRDRASAEEKPDVGEPAADQTGSPPAGRRTGLARLLDFFRLGP